MTLDDAFAIISLTGLVITSAAALFFYIPRLMRSLCRYRLWALRDAVVADVFDGRLPRDHPGVERLIEMVDKAIVATSAVTLFKMVVGEHLFFRNDPPLPVATQVAPLEDPQEAARLKAHEDALLSTMLRHTLMGSPSGWIATLGLAFAVVALTLWSVITKPLSYKLDRAEAVAEAKRPLEERVKMFPRVAELFISARNRNRKAALI